MFEISGTILHTIYPRRASCSSFVWANVGTEKAQTYLIMRLLCVSSDNLGVEGWIYPTLTVDKKRLLLRAVPLLN